MMNTKRLALGVLFVLTLVPNIHAMNHQWITELKDCIELVKQGKGFDIAHSLVQTRMQSRNPEILFLVKELKEALDEQKKSNDAQTINQQLEPSFFTEFMNSFDNNYQGLKDYEQLNRLLHYAEQQGLLNWLEEIVSFKMSNHDVSAVTATDLLFYEILAKKGRLVDQVIRVAESCMSHDIPDVRIAAYSVLSNLGKNHGKLFWYEVHA